MPPRLPAGPVAGLLFALAALIVAVAPASAAAFTDAAGRRVMLPEPPKRVLPAERNAEVLTYVLAPDKLAGLERLPARDAKAGKAPAEARPPVLRFRPGLTPEDVAAAARDYRADLVLDAGPVTPERIAFADAVQRQSGVPYVMLDDSFDRMPSILNTVGTVLGVGARADQLRLFAENSITGMRGRLLIRPAETRPHVYYALGPDGLTTALPGSPAAEAIAEAGAINVAAPLGGGTLVRVSRDQLLAANPDVIIAENRRFYDSLRRDRGWRRLAAVRNNKVYLEPDTPFGWINDPTGVNRLIGLYWLSTLFYPDPTHDEMRGIACEFYDKFYRTRLTNARLNELLEPAGIPRPAPPTQVANPLSDLGTPPAAPGVPGAAVTPGGAVPVIPGTSSGIPGVPNTQPLPSLPDQPDALCTIPGIAAPIGGITGTAPLPGTGPLPGTAPLPGSPAAPVLPGGRIRQPGAGGLNNSTLPGLPPLPNP
jgi:iron complex transport system substrate-binding protein